MVQLEKKKFSDALRAVTLQAPDSPALTCGPLTLTHAQLKAAADAGTLKLIRAGVKKGDRVVLWGFNGIEWIIAYFSIIQAGGIAVLMNYGLKAQDVNALTRMTGASYCIIGGNTISMASPEEAAKAVMYEGLPQNHIYPVSVFAWREDLPGLTEEEQEMIAAADQAVEPEDSQVIIFTTGTTSAPKAVLLSSRSIISNCEGTVSLLEKDISDKLCLALPLFHSYGLTVLNIYLLKGKRIYISPLLKPDILADMIAGNGIQDICSVGAIYGMMTRLPDFQEKLAGKLRICVVGGGFTTPVEMMRLEKVFEGAKLICGYGQTECSPIISVETPLDTLEKRAISVGHPLPNHEVRIWSEKTGFVEQGGIGEIVVKGPSLMNGYLGLPEEMQAVDQDGWLHTGDLGRFDEDGMLQFAGRIKDIIIRSGENISPVEIEKALLSEPEIREAKVLSAPHQIWGESVEACIVLNQTAFDEEDLRKRLRTKLSSFKIPSHFFVYEMLPLNENGKLDQRSLKADMLNRLYELFLSTALDEGLRILDLRLKNRGYTVVPACSMVEQLAEQLGNDRSRSEKIRLSVEEMLTDRIDHAFEDNGEIRMEVLLMPHWLRLRFTDTGREYRLDSDEASISAKIILANVDAYSSGKNKDGETEYRLDYQYREDFNVKTYLMRYKGK